MKTWTFVLLTLLLGFAPAASAGTTQAPFQTTLCGDQSLGAIFSVNAQAPAPGNDLFVLQAADQPICEVFCATSPCQSNSECTAAPNGHCRFACPEKGCCVYPE